MRRPLFYALFAVVLTAAAAGTFALGSDDDRRARREAEVERARWEELRTQLPRIEEAPLTDDVPWSEEPRERGFGRAELAQGERMGRHYHFVRAAEHLDLAGCPDLAARLRHAAEEIERDAFAPKGTEQSDDLSRHVREITQGLRRMNQRIDELSATVERLETRVGEIGR